LKRRSGLAFRIAALSVGIAIVTALIAGTLSIGLIRSSADGAGRSTLAHLADVAQTFTERNDSAVARSKIRKALGSLNVRIAFVAPAGRLVAPAALARQAVTSDDITAVLAGRSVSTSHGTTSGSALVEGRPTPDGGVFAVQRRADAIAPQEKAIRRIVLALLIAGAIAAVLGLAVAARLAAPLRRAARAAQALADGRRDVSVPAGGPAEVAEVSDAVNALSHALNQSEARQREFLLSVSHDLRTPLTSIAGYAESLAEGVVPPGETVEVGEVVLAEARRLERLVGDLLDLARLGAHDFHLDVAPADLTELARAAADVWYRRCSAAGVAFRAELPAHPVVVHTDAGRLRQALDGLMENALRMTPVGRPIVLAVRLARPYALLEVRDGGPGLRPEDLAVAFDRGELYRRYRGVRQVGTGLGLAIVRGLLTRLGATIEAGHALEGGARFTIQLSTDPTQHDPTQHDPTQHDPT
jgi:two-component system sensor histidine kinase BaeS